MIGSAFVVGKAKSKSPSGGEETHSSLVGPAGRASDASSSPTKSSESRSTSVVVCIERLEDSEAVGGQRERVVDRVMGVNMVYGWRRGFWNGIRRNR